MAINRLISVCTRADGHTFEVASRYVQNYIPAKDYVVFVPEADLDFFSSLNLGSYAVESEEKYRDIAHLLERKELGQRFGWYFQQFIKMAELEDGDDDDLNLIWDADTIPLRSLNFISNDKVFFYQGREFHRPYFRLIKELLGVDKLSSTSFIAQSLPYRVKWFKQFKSDLEASGEGLWYEKIVELIDPKEESGFSEYETLGTYAVWKFGEEIQISERLGDWYRRGNSLIGGPQNVGKYHSALKKRYDFVSFEKSDKGKAPWHKRLRLVWPFSWLGKPISQKRASNAAPSR